MGLSKKSRICPERAKRKPKAGRFGRFSSILNSKMRGFWFSCDFLDNPMKMKIHQLPVTPAKEESMKENSCEYDFMVKTPYT
jgi:hypothetical protein